MAITIKKAIAIHQHCRVAPPTGEAAEQQHLPLTYFDMIWLYFRPIQRLLFYRCPCSTTNFVEIIVPNLKKSLSQAFKHYCPLAGNLVRPLDSGMPELRYLPGDSVSVTFAEINEAFDFDYLTGDQARDSDQFYNFVPELPEPRTESDSGFVIIPVLAIQVTLFPETGICVGFSNHHGVGDASSIVGFIKAWSSLAKNGGNEEILAEKKLIPFCDRAVIKDLSGRANIFWNQMRASKLGSTRFNLPTNKLRATFVLRKDHIQLLKNLVSARIPGSGHLSCFTVTTAYVWACLARSAAAAGEEVDDNEPEYFGFAVDARHRLEPPLPAAYFGNCLAFVVVEATHGKLKGNDGFLAAAELVGEIIGKKVNNKEELLRDADEWLVKYGPISNRLLGVAGSPKFDLYDTDFGWGNPKKFESVSIDAGGSFSLCKSREFEGGLEIGMSLPEKKMDAFAAVFSHGLKI